MNARRLTVIPIFLILMLTSACKSKISADEAYIPMEGAADFDIQLESGPANLGQTTIWLGGSQSAGHSATFRIELGNNKAGNGSVPISFGKGRLLSVAGSDASVLLSQLKTALQAKSVPQGIKRAPSVPFTYAVLGRRTRREKDGSFGEENTGNWIALKLFFGDGESEVYLNLNPVLRKGEFTIKDPDYGDAVIGELAKVL